MKDCWVKWYRSGTWNGRRKAKLCIDSEVKDISDMLQCSGRANKKKMEAQRLMESENEKIMSATFKIRRFLQNLWDSLFRF